PGHRGREADAVVGAVDVVVHRLGDGDRRHPLLVHPQPVGQGVVATDRDEHVDAGRLDDPQDVRGEVVRTVTLDRPGQEVGNVAGPHLPGVRARAVQEGATGPVDGAHTHRVEVDQVLCHGRRVVEVGAQQTAPPPPDAGDLVPLLVDPVDHGLDAGVESRDVTAAGEDADAHVVALLPLLAGAAPPRPVVWGARQANGAGGPALAP